MSERDTNVLEVLVGQVGQYRGVNFIFGKTLRVLPETKLPKPVRNLLHVSPPDLPTSGRQLDSLSTSLRNCSRFRALTDKASRRPNTERDVRFGSEADICRHRPMSALPPIATAKADMPQW